MRPTPPKSTPRGSPPAAAVARRSRPGAWISRVYVPNPATLFLDQKSVAWRLNVWIMRQYGAPITHFILDNPDIWWYEGASWYPGRCRLPTISGLTQPSATCPVASGLLGFDDRAADRARLGKARFERVGFAPADRALQRRQILGEALHDFEHRLAIGEKDVAPHDRIGGGDAREIAKAAGGKRDDFGFEIVGEIGRRADDRIGDQMRQMRGHRQHFVVMVGGHLRHAHAGSLPEARHLLHRLGRCVGERRQDAPAVVEQFGEARLGARMLRAGDGVAGHKMHPLRNERLYV